MGKYTMREPPYMVTGSEGHTHSQIEARQILVDVKGLVINFEDHFWSQVVIRPEGPNAIARLRPGFAVGGKARRHRGESLCNALIRRPHVVVLPARERCEPGCAVLPYGIRALQIVAEEFRRQWIGGSGVVEIESRGIRKAAARIQSRNLGGSGCPAGMPFPKRDAFARQSRRQRRH